MNTVRRLVPVLMLAAAGCGYNTIQTTDEQVSAALAQIKVQLQRRADLIPNLVATVQGFAQQERDVLIQVTEARARVGSASSGCPPTRTPRR